MVTVEQLFETAVRELAPSDRHRLIGLLQAEPDSPEQPYWMLPGYSSEWTEEDFRDLSAATVREIEKRYPDDDGQPETR